MPITTLDPKTALVVIDILKGIAKMETAHPAGAVIDNVVKLVDAFHAKGQPVVQVRVGWAADFGDALKTRNQAPAPAVQRSADFFEYLDAMGVDPKRDILIEKRQWGAFYGTDLDLQLRRRGVTNVVMCGIATSIGVESTARDAWERGYNMTFASDAMTDMHAGAHDRALEVIFPRIGEIGTTAEVIAKL
jgi:nicotinamidase-related amidase